MKVSYKFRVKTRFIACNEENSTNFCYLPNDEPLDATDCAICFHLSKYSAIATTEGIRAIPIPVPGVALENILTW